MVIGVQVGAPRLDLGRGADPQLCTLFAPQVTTRTWRTAV